MENDSILTECESCGEVRDCTLCVDPFVVEDIYGPYSEEDRQSKWWCAECFDNRADDV